MCEEEGQVGIHLLDAEYSHPYVEGPLLLVEWWLYTLIVSKSMTTTRTRINQKPELPNSLSMRSCSSKQRMVNGGSPPNYEL